MSMFTITGKVMNVFTQPPRKDSDGNEVQEKTKVQILGHIPAENGESRLDLVTLTAPDSINVKDCIGKDVRLPLGFFAPSRGSIVYFIPKGSTFLNVA